MLQRAGCNFSAISGTDANAIRWDKAGYKFLREIESTVGPEKSFVKRTPSTEMWDNVVPHDKIKAMSEYLEDVRHSDHPLWKDPVARPG